MKPAALLALCLALTHLLAPARAAAQEAQPDEVIKVNTDLVVLDAQVLSKKTKRAVADLRREDFELYEDGARREIGYFSRDELPLSVLLLLDVSGSVRPIIERVGEGAQDALGRLKPGDEVAVMAFASASKLIQGFSKDRQLVADKIKEASREYSVGSGTLLTEALYAAAREMQNSTNQASRRVVIVVTDNVAFLGNKNGVRRTTNELLESGAVVYGLVVRAAFGKVFNALTLGKVNPVEHFGVETGGEVSGADKGEVGVKLGEMFARLRTRYSLGFKPADTREDGRLRRLKLQLTPAAAARSGRVIVLTKRGYYFRRRGAPRPARPALDAERPPAPREGSTRPRRTNGAPPPLTSAPPPSRRLASFLPVP
ncbi:MAG: VWA domain-containing protein [Acidobacteria bacterium]|nr:VWA domain-containing protein [Acidobacteriota bacterium]MCA1642838.1 VWA domain-containing protein [Acidobacteriota bacterium]